MDDDDDVAADDNLAMQMSMLLLYLPADTALCCPLSAGVDTYHLLFKSLVLILFCFFHVRTPAVPCTRGQIKDRGSPT